MVVQNIKNIKFLSLSLLIINIIFYFIFIFSPFFSSFHFFWVLRVVEHALAQLSSSFFLSIYLSFFSSISSFFLHSLVSTQHSHSLTRAYARYIFYGLQIWILQTSSKQPVKIFHLNPFLHLFKMKTEQAIKMGNLLMASIKASFDLYEHSRTIKRTKIIFNKQDFPWWSSVYVHYKNDV